MRVKECTTRSEFEVELARLNCEEFVVLDLETTGLNPFSDTVIDIGLLGASGDLATVSSGTLAPSLSLLRAPIVAQNFRFDFRFLEVKAGVDLLAQGSLHSDPMLLDHLLDENVEHGLEAILQRRYGTDAYKSKFWDKYKGYTDAPREAQVEYLVQDLVYTLKVTRDLHKDLQLDGIPSDLIAHVHDLAASFYRTEVAGVRLDLDYLEQIGAKLAAGMQASMQTLNNSLRLECKIVEDTMHLEKIKKLKTDKGKRGASRSAFNWDSASQLGALLYDVLELPEQLKNHKRTVDKGAMEKLAILHPAISVLNEYNKAQTVYDTFIKGTLERMHGGRIYPKLNVNGTVGERVSSAAPNLQNLPREGGVRGIYVPDPGHKFISADYGSVEVVVAAHLSQDPNLLKIVLEGVSQHDITNESLGLGSRQLAKTLNFACQYRCSPHKIAQIIGVSAAEGERIWKKYWDTYKGLRKLHLSIDALLDAGQPVVTPYGRKRRFPKTFASIRELEHARRQASNFLVQSTAGYLTNRSVYLVNAQLIPAGWGRVVWPIHDQLLTQAVWDRVEDVRQVMIETMEARGQDIGMTLPLRVDCSEGTERWVK